MLVFAETSTFGEPASRTGSDGELHGHGAAVSCSTLALTAPDVTPTSFIPSPADCSSGLSATTRLPIGPRSAQIAGEHVSDAVCVMFPRISMPSMSPGVGGAYTGPKTPIANR